MNCDMLSRPPNGGRTWCEGLRTVANAHCCERFWTSDNENIFQEKNMKPREVSTDNDASNTSDSNDRLIAKKADNYFTGSPSTYIFAKKIVRCQ